RRLRHDGSGVARHAPAQLRRHRRCGGRTRPGGGVPGAAQQRPVPGDACPGPGLRRLAAGQHPPQPDRGPTAGVNGTIEVGLRGPLDIRVAGRAVPFRSPKHRILLAALLVEPGRTVPVAKLVEAVWGAAPPANPRRAVQLYITRVRTVLAEAGARELIHTELDGYRADIDVSTVDIGPFHELL